MIYDPIAMSRRQGGKRRFGWTAIVALVLLCAVSAVVFCKEARIELVDFSVHMNIAGDFDFSDLHTITSRLAYPMWHLLVSVVYQLGVPLEASAVAVSVLCKAVTYLLAYWLIDTASERRMKRWIVGLAALAAVVLTGLWFPPNSVYKGVGSPNVWHNPTQLAVTVAMLMVMPWLVHCWCEFERRLSQGETGVMLPWWKVAVLAVFLMGSLACKPTFLQALLPAAFVMYLVELIRHKTEWRYFGQIVAAFLPAVGYFLLQYLYYTGVVVEFTSGVEIGITAQSAWIAIRNTLRMSACPLAALLVCWRKGMFKDRSLVLALAMTLFSVLEAMAFRETGLREGHGNFTWAANSSSFYLWVVMMGIFLRTIPEDVKRGMCALRKAGYAAVFALFGWHVVSGVYYLYHLLVTSNAF